MMDKDKFIEELRRKLKRLPKEEVDNIITYYLDYFEDADKDETEVLKELGNPSKIASQILSDYAFNSGVENNKKNNTNKILLVILSIFAAPIALPLAIAVIVIWFAMILVIGALLLSFAVATLAFILAGVITSIVGSLVMVQGPATGVLYIGIGLASIGIGILLGLGIKNLSPKVYAFIKNTTMKLVSKINKPKLKRRAQQ